MRDHRNPARGVLHHDLEDAPAFGSGQRGVLPRSATDDERVDSGVDAAVDNRSQQFGVDLVVGSERGGKRGQYAAEFFGHVGLLSDRAVTCGEGGSFGHRLRVCHSVASTLAAPCAAVKPELTAVSV